VLLSVAPLGIELIVNRIQRIGLTRGARRRNAKVQRNRLTLDPNTATGQPTAPSGSPSPARNGVCVAVEVGRHRAQGEMVSLVGVNLQAR